MDAVLDQYALDMLGAAIRKDREGELRSSLPAELTDLCDRLRTTAGSDERNGRDSRDRRH